MKSKKAPWNDNPAWTAKNFKRAKPLKDVLPALAEASKRARGRPKLEDPKEQVTLRLDAEVLRAFREDGPGWQSRINATLVKAVGRSKMRKKVG
ncbi:MAG: BrnA antitoxin family protein [Rhizomicrobium sp.]